MIRIRSANPNNAETIRTIHLSAFPDGEGERIARLAVDLLSEETNPPILSLVAETDGEIVGHMALSPLTLNGHEDFHGYILAPLAVSPKRQKHGIGSQLIRDGIRRLSETDAGILLVYGDPDYYGRFGFRTEVAEYFLPPYELKYPFGWQGMILGNREPARSPMRIRCVPSLLDPMLW